MLLPLARTDWLTGGEPPEREGLRPLEMTRRRPTKGGGATSRPRRTHLDLASGEGEKTSGPAKSNAKKSLRSLAPALVCAAFVLVLISRKVLAPKGEQSVSTAAAAKKSSGHHHQPTELLPPDSIYRVGVQDIQGSWVQLDKFAGSVSLVVNVACE